MTEVTLVNTKAGMKNPGFELEPAVVSGLNIRLYDLTDPKWDVEAGVYYSIPVEEAGVVASERLTGPYADRDAAIQGARDFIEKADAEMSDDVSDEEITEEELSDDDKARFGATPFIFPVDAKELA